MVTAVRAVLFPVSSSIDPAACLAGRRGFRRLVGQLLRAPNCLPAAV